MTDTQYYSYTPSPQVTHKIDSNEKRKLEEVLRENFYTLKNEIFSGINEELSYSNKLDFTPENYTDHLADISLISKDFAHMSYSLDSTLNMSTTIVHELTHWILFKYGLNHKHTLEFSILYSVLALHHTSKYKHFLRPYDIHEDEMYEELAMNMKNFDTMIIKYQYTTIDNAVIFALQQAEIIRNNKGN